MIHRRWRPELRLRQGLSLVEVLIATTLLAIGFVGVAGALSCAAKTSRLAEDQMAAESLASGLLAEARAAGYSSLSTWFTYPGESSTTGLEQAFSARLAESGLPNPHAWFTVTNVQTDLRGVSVVIDWGAPSRVARVESETLVSARF